MEWDGACQDTAEPGGPDGRQEWRDTQALRALVESSEVAIIGQDLQGNVTTWNPAAERLFGFTASEVLGRPDATLPVPQEEGEESVARRLARGERIEPALARLRRKDGAEIEVMLSCSAIRDPSGQVVGTSRIACDCSELKRQEQQLRLRNAALELENARARQASRAKGDFLANMSHELRTPLNAIIGFTELLLDGHHRDSSELPQHNQFLKETLASGQHLLGLINDILEFAKVEAGKVTFNPAPTNLREVVSEVSSVLASTATSKGIRVVTEVDDALACVNLDPSRLKQVLYNYLSNALKFTDSGTVTVRALADGSQRFRLEVQDTGIGIAADDLHRLFVEFHQLDTVTHKRYPGTGLGLALTKRLVEAQGGSVGVSSEPGRGSLFWAVLPCVAGAVPREQRPAAPAGARDTGIGRATVLVIEDDLDDQETLIGVLEQAGFAVEVAATGAAAVARLRQRRFSAITLDMLLPDVPGTRVLAEIRRDTRNHDVPVVVVTQITEIDALESLEVSEILHKPVDPGSLLLALDAAGARPEPFDSILVIDDDPGSLTLMSAALAQLGHLAVCRKSSARAVEDLPELRPRAIILDLLMPELNGFEVLEHLRLSTTVQPPPVLVWTIKDLTPEEKQRLGAAQPVLRKGDGGMDGLLSHLRALLASCEPATSPSSRRTATPELAQPAAH